MALSMKKATGGGDDDVNVTLEDQQKINKFARKSNKLGEIQDEITNKKKDLQNLEDAADELVLGDDDDFIPYQIGEVFFHQSLEDAQQSVENAKTRMEEGIAALEAQGDGLKGELGDLKAQLYAKFGKNINLEMDED
ncbi:prefoldin subunit 4-like [Strongylocentrotus purpuratus]|uniref:Prefoldin subunit 4 n=1 Tax=Strongylocentrotus purpuratus TaxID=7668 RepID=A0A7M7N6M2_STRPU|nr:prefoldin subunit 4-like [Strongylocentrotus purpuratus]|eukprot:XP_011671928.1 PREDICTED: prefoldin subunit 4 [Strongylocentrotus purpuratus]